MLKVHTLTLGAYQTNTYIVHDSAAKTCVVIDPGYEAFSILEAVHGLGLTLEAVLLTHGHFDHVGAVEPLVTATGCKLWMHQADWSQFPGPATAFFYPLANCDFCEVWFCEDEEILHAGGLSFTVLSTPGPPQGSVCYRCETALFSGDTLFARSCGRTDLPGGDHRQLVDSLSRLASLEGDLTVYPGHGESTTLSRERAYNPYMR